MAGNVVGLSDPTMSETIYQFSAKTVDGQEVSLEKYK